MKKTKLMSAAWLAICIAAGSDAATIDDHFDDDELTTNSSGTGSGSGFNVLSNGVTLSEADGLASIIAGSSGANSGNLFSKDSFDANSPGGITASFKLTEFTRDVSAGGAGRYYIGVSADSSHDTGDPLTGGFQAKGLWIVLHTRNDNAAFAGIGNLQSGLVYNNGSANTILAAWDWDPGVITFDTAGAGQVQRYGIDFHLDDLTFDLRSDDAGWALSFSSSDAEATLPAKVSGTWAAASVTNDLDTAYLAMSMQSSNNGRIDCDRVVVAPGDGLGEEPLAITAIVLEGDGQITLTWNSMPGRVYTIYWSTELGKFATDVADDFASGGAETSITFDNPTISKGKPDGAPRVFFRVAEN